MPRPQKYHTQEEKKAAKTQQYTARTQARVHIKGEITQWKAIGEENELGNNEKIARFLLDL